MGLFDRLFRRPATVRSYEAATPSARRFNAGAALFGGYGPEGAVRGTIQARARHFAANNPLAHAALSAWATAVVGAGMMPTSQHPDPATREALDRAFAAWARRADLEGRQTFAAMQAALVRAEWVDGESFARWAGDQLQLIPAEMVDMALTVNLPHGFIVNGVECDGAGRWTALHIHAVRPTDLFPTYAPPFRVGRDDCLHVFRPTGPGAVRGVSKLAPVLLRLAELDGLEDALQVNAKVAALMAMILTNENDPSGEDPLADGQGLEPGAVLKIPGGWKVNATAPQQAQQVAEFLMHMTRTIAAGVDVPEHLMTGDLRQANYSSLRAALVSFRQKVEAFQYQTLVPQFLDPVWRRVVTSAVLSGDVRADLSDDLFAVEWIAPAQPWVDPLKDAEATALLIDRGLMSRRQAVAAMGYSVTALDEEIAADKARESELGLSFDAKPKAVGEAKE
jgi:lambda family phage portal protein